MAAIAALIGALLAAPLALLAILLGSKRQPPSEIHAFPSIGTLCWNILASALSRKRAQPGSVSRVQVKVVVPTEVDAQRYAAYLRLVGFSTVPPDLPLTYPLVEAFRLTLHVLAHPDFPYPVLGSVLARNTVRVARPLRADERLLWSCHVVPEVLVTDKGHTEVQVVTVAAGPEGTELYHNTLTVIIMNHKTRGRRPAAAAAAVAPPAPERRRLATMRVPPSDARTFAALSGDRNPIHMSTPTARLFGFPRPIAHALYLVGRLEAELINAGTPVTYPAVFTTEFKRPTLLPATLQVTVTPGAQPPLQCSVLTQDGSKEVVVGRLSSA